MYPPPEGVFESEAQTQELDDTFLSSDPLGYFMSRIAMLHHWASCGVVEPTEDDPTAGVPALGAVGRTDVNAVIEALFADQEVPRLPKLVVSAQVAVDAFALRHHLAEALLRLFVACVEDEQAGAGDPPASMWARLTDNRQQTIGALLTRSREVLDGLMPEGFASFVLPPTIPVTQETHDRALTTVRTYGSWLIYAMDLLEPGVLDTTSAHNKVKHGLAVRGRSDLRMTFSLVGPNADGTIDLSSLTGQNAVDVFARPVLEFLARAPRTPTKGKEGLELTQLELNYRVILADAVMLALAHGALFHVAAHRHFADRELPTGLKVAPHPGFVGNLPEPNHAGHQVGMRFPITTPEHDGTPRHTVITWPDGTYQTLQFTGEAMRNVLVIDPTGDDLLSQADQEPAPGSDDEHEPEA